MLPRLLLAGLLVLLSPVATAQKTERGGQDSPRARASEAPPSDAEVDAALKELKKSRRAGDRNRHLTVVLRSDSADGRRYVSNMLRGAFDGQKRNLITTMSEVSPASWWEVACEHIDSRDDDVRMAVAQALTRFGEAKAVRAIRGRLQRERIDAVRGPLLLALASSGARDATVAAELDKLAENPKAGEAVRYAVALGAAKLADEEVALRIVRRGLGDALAKVRAAAAAAAVEAKLTKALPDLRTAAEHEGDADAKRFLQAAVRAAESGDARTFETLRRRLEQRDRTARGGNAQPGRTGR